MIRLLGFLVGSAASIGAIFLLLGVPELNLSNPNLDKERFEEALQQLRDKQRQVEQVVADEATPEAPAPDMPITPEAPVAEQEMTANAIAPAIVNEQHWHTFWNPFRTEIAARGFVSQLERVTGLDYRIIKVKTGVYEVAFAYKSDADRQLHLSQIQAATGLDLPGS
jgi:hypothetical protein